MSLGYFNVFNFVLVFEIIKKILGYSHHDNLAHIPPNVHSFIFSRVILFFIAIVSNLNKKNIGRLTEINLK